MWRAVAKTSEARVIGRKQPLREVWSRRPEAKVAALVTGVTRSRTTFCWLMVAGSVSQNESDVAAVGPRAFEPAPPGLPLDLDRE